MKKGYTKKASYDLFFQRLTTIYIALMVSVFLLFVAEGYEKITSEKALCFFVLTVPYVLIATVGRAELAVIGKLPPIQVSVLWNSLHPTQKLIFLYWCLTLVSTLLSVDFQTSLFGTTRFDGFLTITLYCWSFLVISHDWVPKKWLVWLFAATISISSIISMLQFCGANPLGLFPKGMNYYDAFVLYSGQFLGTLGNVDIYSAVLCIAIPLFLTAILKFKDKKRFLLILPLFLCLIVLCKAFVAGGIVAVSVGTVCILPFLVSNIKHRKRLLCIVAVGFVVLLVIVFFFGEQIGGFIGEAGALMHGDWDDDFGSGRVYIWRKAAALIPNRPLFGGGPDTFGLRTDASFQRLDENTGVIITSAVDVAHNEYLNILVNQGALALVAYLIAIFLRLRVGAGMRQQDPP